MKWQSLLTPASSKQERPREDNASGSCSRCNSASRMSNSCTVSQNRALWWAAFNDIEKGEHTIVFPVPALSRVLATLPSWSCIHATAQSQRSNQPRSSPSMDASGSNNSAQALPCTDNQASITRHSRRSCATGPFEQSTSSCCGNCVRSLLMAGTASKTSPSDPG
jgi:hypothetical protein